MPRSVSHEGWYRSLDFWRGIACLMVVIDHAALAAIGPFEIREASGAIGRALRTLAVDSTRLALGPSLFFVISGYCIASSLESIRRKGKSPWQFIRRRLWRTFPPYWVALGVLALAVLSLDAAGLTTLHDGPYGERLEPPQALGLAQWLGTLCLSETWRPLVTGGEGRLYLGAAWTLCYLEQFYAIAFLVLLLDPGRLHRVLAGLSVGIVLFRIAAWDCGMLPHIDGLFPVYWTEFAVGLLVYWRLNTLRDRADWRLVVDALLIGVVVVSSFGGARSTAVAGCFGLLLVALRPFDARLADPRWLEPLRACGRRCFSIYLIHLPFVAIGDRLLYEAGLQSFWARALIVVPSVSLVAIAAGWGFYRLVESRFRELPALPARQPVPVPASIPAPTLARAA